MMTLTQKILAIGMVVATSICCEAQITYSEAMQLNKLYRGATDAYPANYGKAYDLMLSKGHLIRSHSIGPTQASSTFKRVLLTYTNFKGTQNSEIVSVDVVEKNDPTLGPVFVYMVQVSTKSFDQYVQWRIDAKNGFTGTYLYAPYVDSFTIPPKNGSSFEIKISVPNPSQPLPGPFPGNTNVPQDTFYLMITRTTQKGSTTDI